MEPLPIPAVFAIASLAFVSGWILAARIVRRDTWLEAAETLRSVHRIHGIWQPLPSACCARLYQQFRELARIWGAS